MDMTWEKIVVWMIALLVLIVIIVFIVTQLSPHGDGFIGKIFDGIGSSTETTTP